MSTNQSKRSDASRVEIQKSAGSRSSQEEASIENYILSPSPVPLDYEAAFIAINAAARRSNSSRTHSVKTQPYEGSCDTQIYQSSQELHKPQTPELASGRSKRRARRSNFAWSRLLCCISPRSSTKSTSAHNKPHAIPTGDCVTVENGKTDTRTIKSKSGTWRRHLFGSQRSASKHQSVPVSSPSDLTDNSSTHNSSPLTDDVFAVNSTHAPFSITFPRLSKPCSQSNPLNGLSLDEANHHSSSSSKDCALRRVWTNTGDGDAADEAYLVNEENTDSQFVDDKNGGGGQGDSRAENLSLYDVASPGTKLLGDLPEDCVNKKCLVLDLDETLVHSWFKYVDNANFVVPVEVDGIRHEIYVCKRPHLDEFLRAVGPLFECVMFTASLQKYADPVCDEIDKESHFRHRLFREACVYHQHNLIKDLSCLGRDIDQICIVDNSPVSFLFQPSNALQIVSWFDDPYDQALLELIPYLTGLAQSETVVDYLREVEPPRSAAIANPRTPSWLMLFHPGHAGDEDEEVDDSTESLTAVDGTGFCMYLQDEHAILSPHSMQPQPKVITNQANGENDGGQTADPHPQLPTGLVHQVSRPMMITLDRQVET